MAINRAPFNALVDDDGSNTIGTPWNKAAIAGVILDPVDAALAPLGAAGVWTTFTPVPGANVAIGTVHAARYTLVGKTMVVSFYALVTVSGAPTSFTIALPAGAVAATLSASALLYSGTALGFGMTQTQATVASLGFLRDISSVTPWAAGSYTIGTTATFAIQ